jgi:hypothetical protein
VTVVQRNLPRPPQRQNAPTVRLVDERRFEPPRQVEVERDGIWWPGWCTGWLLCDDDRGWRALVEYVAVYDWGRGKHLGSVPPARVRQANCARGPHL